jgi:hypothetical protein
VAFFVNSQLQSTVHYNALLVLSVCFSTPALWYRLPMNDVPLPEFSNCPRPTATVTPDSQCTLHFLQLPHLVSYCSVGSSPNNWLLLSVRVKSLYYWRSVRQCILASIPFWFSWSDAGFLWRKKKLSYDRRLVGQSVLMLDSHLEPMTTFLLSACHLPVSCYGHPLWREDGSVLLVQLLLRLARAVTLGSKSCRPRDSIYCRIFSSPLTTRDSTTFPNKHVLHMIRYSVTSWARAPAALPRTFMVFLRSSRQVPV